MPNILKNGLVPHEELKQVMHASSRAELVVLLKAQGIPYILAKGGRAITTLANLERAAANETHVLDSDDESLKPQSVKLV